MSELIVSITDAEFEDSVLKSTLPVLVDFWAPWCQPCKLIAPVLDEVASAKEGKLRVMKMDVADNRDVAARYSVQSIPCLILFKDGVLAGKNVGVVSQAQLQAFLEEHLEG